MDYRQRNYYVYIMSNRSKTLYTGVTSRLRWRVFEHKKHIYLGFTSRYRINRLVYYETFNNIRAAIEREKQIKGMLRIKKIALIVAMNPTWKDLSEDWRDEHRYQPEECIDPSLRSG